MMSQQNNPESVDSDSDTHSEFTESEYRRPIAMSERTVDTANESHPLKEELGDTDHRDFKFDPKSNMQLLAGRYEDPWAFLREYIANAQTACIRRLRHEIVDADAVPDTYDSVYAMSDKELRECARERELYEPVIEIYHSAHESDLPAMQIRDNGIGISVEEFRVLRTVGLSASHDRGSDLGQFGQGLVSGFAGVGEQGDIVCDTHSYIDDASYGFRMRMGGLNDRPGRRDSYGTTFTFPSLTYDIRGDDVQSVIEKYTELISIPVVYEEYDESNTHVTDEEYQPKYITDRFDSEPIVWSDENNMVTAVMWPEVGHKHNSKYDTETYLITMPIDRNDSTRRNSGKKFKAPFHFDLVVNYEDGRILEDKNGNTGKVPVNPRAYDTLDDDMTDDCVSKDDLTEYAIALPEPVNDRDRFESGNKDTYEYISKQLAKQYYEEFKPELQELVLYGLDSLRSMDQNRGEAFVSFINNLFTSNRPSKTTIKDKLQLILSTTISDDIIDEIYTGFRPVQLTDREDKYNVTRARHRDKMSVYELYAVHLDESADVYMSARTVHSVDKARVVWGLDESNVLVVISQASKYGLYENTLGWKKCKNISLTDLGEQYPSLPSDIIDDVGVESDDDNSQSQTEQTPSTYTKRSRTVKLRYSGEIQHEVTSGYLRDNYPETDTDTSPYTTDIEHIIVLRQTEYSSVECHNQYSKHVDATNTARVIVPNYVADFLTEKDGFHDGVEEYKRAIQSESMPAIEISDIEQIADGSADIEGYDDMYEQFGTDVSLDTDPNIGIIMLSNEVTHLDIEFESSILQMFIDSIVTTINDETDMSLFDHDIDYLSFVHSNNEILSSDTSIRYYYPALRSDDVDIPLAVLSETHTELSTLATNTVRDNVKIDECIDVLLPDNVFEQDTELRDFVQDLCKSKFNRSQTTGVTVEFIETLAEVGDKLNE